MADHGTDESVPARWNALDAGSNMWMDWDDDPRNTGAELEGERATLVDYLRSYRLILEMKCADLDAEQLARQSVPPSTMSLLGLIRHMADVERHWFRRVMAGQDVPSLYWSDEIPDADWAGAVADAAVVAEAWQSWRDGVGFAEQFVADADDLGIRGTMRDGTSVALREVILHMIEEYARHAGHADLLRERIDGRVGQLSPGGTTPRNPPVSARAGLIAKKRRSYQARPRGLKLRRPLLSLGLLSLGLLSLGPSPHLPGGCPGGQKLRGSRLSPGGAQRRRQKLRGFS